MLRHNTVLGHSPRLGRLSSSTCSKCTYCKLSRCGISLGKLASVVDCLVELLSMCFLNKLHVAKRERKRECDMVWMLFKAYTDFDVKS